MFAAFYLILENKSVVAAVLSEIKDIPDVARKANVHEYDGK
jgi:hypothetical protein